jgi:hypothetical protein
MTERELVKALGTDATLAEARAVIRHAMVSRASGETWQQLALALFRWQCVHNEVYGDFVKALGLDAHDIRDVESIACMPVEAFKHHTVQSTTWDIHHTFRSSGTSSTAFRSQHHLDSEGMDWYRFVSEAAWDYAWGDKVDQFDWAGLLPGYIGREDASLIAMVTHFMESSDSPKRLFMEDHAKLNQWIDVWGRDRSNRSVVLFGVTWAILDWIEGVEQGHWTPRLASKLRLIETGGMKGRGEEPIRAQVHERIRAALPGIQIASEYGMTEMMSQAYARDGVRHGFPPWVIPVIREPRDPFSVVASGRSGRLDVMDLANVHSCAFLATSDLAQGGELGIEMLGRVDRSDLRGCSLLASD